MNEAGVEFAPFLKRPDVSEADLIAASDALDDFLRTVDGFLGRMLLKKNESEWHDLVFWRDRAAADAVIPKVAGSEACRRYFACMVAADHDDPAAGVTHWQHVKSWGRTSL